MITLSVEAIALCWLRVSLRIRPLIVKIMALAVPTFLAHMKIAFLGTAANFKARQMMLRCVMRRQLVIKGCTFFGTLVLQGSGVFIELIERTLLVMLKLASHMIGLFFCRVGFGVRLWRVFSLLDHSSRLARGWL